VSPQQRTGQRHKLQNFIEEKERKSKRKYHKRRSGGLLPGGIEALLSLFKDQFKQIWAVLRDGLGWLAGLINTPLSHNVRYSVHLLMVISKPLIVCLRCEQYS
jgi:hypothetical protein